MIVRRRRSTGRALRSRRDLGGHAAAAPQLLDRETRDLGLRIADIFDPPEHPYMRNLKGWVHDVLGEETWSKQDEILDSIVANRKTGVWSAHSTGKSHIASRAAAAWVEVHPLDDVFVVSSAPSAPQVRGILWRYVKAAHRKGNLGGNITDAEIPEWKIDGRLVGWGRKPANLTSEESAKAVFQGIHAKYVLVILDEADGIPKWLWDAVTTLLTSPTNRLLAIGNPDNPQSHFAAIRKDPEATDWNKITITAYDSPAFTGEPVSDDLLEHLVSEEWVEEVAREWGEDSPLFTSKVKAQYPDIGDDALITPMMLAKAFEAWDTLPGTEQGRYAADIARMGKDKTVVYRNRGGRIEKIDEWAKKTTDVTTDKLAAILAPHQNGVPMVIDMGGGHGAGPFDNLRRDGYPVVQFDGSMKPMSDETPRPDGIRFRNRRAEQYWALREEMDRYAIGLDPSNLKAQAQLLNIKWGNLPTGRLFVEKKEDIVKRIGHSPDEADAIMMSTVPTDEWELYAQDWYANSGREAEHPKSETADLLGRPM